MNDLKTKIDEVKTKLGVSTMQLSKRLGKNPYYLYKVLNGVSTERQNELIRELDLVANGGTVMTERAIIAELTEKAESLQEKLNNAQSANKELCHKIKLAENEYKELDAAYGRACEKIYDLSDISNKYKRKFYNMAKLNTALIILIIIYSILWWVA